MNVTIMISALKMGGAERVAAVVSEELARRGYDVTLVTTRPVEDDFFAIADPRVKRVVFSYTRQSRNPLESMVNYLRSLRKIRNVLRSTNPDVVVSFLYTLNIMVLMAMAGGKTPVIVTEHNHPAFSSKAARWRILRRLFYPRAARLVCVSRGVAGYFTWIPEARKQVIYNPLAPRFAEGAQEKGGFLKEGRRYLVAMGRLVHQKGFDILLEAYKGIADSVSDWDLLILGDGPERKNLERLVDEYGLSGRALLPGRVSDPATVLKRCSVFVLSSRHEGFGNVLVEAMACGLPCVSFDCPAGPNEIVEDGVDGILVRDIDAQALRRAMERLIRDEALRGRMAENALRKARRFSAHIIMDEWEKALHGVVSNRHE